MPPSVVPLPEAEYCTYRIIVKGQLDSSLVSLLNGLEISFASQEGTSISIVHGKLPDQAALGGVLDVLIDHRYTLMSVKRIDHP